VLRSPGQPLDSGARAFMEPRFDHDFSHVRVHTDARAAESARAVNALAYTVGRDVVFGPNQYAPNTWSGRRLLAHELVHTIQQNSGGSILQPRLAVGAANAPEEREADRAAENALRGEAQVSPVGDIMLRRTIGDGHDLTSPRFAGDTKLEAAYDDETLLSRARDSRGTPVRLIQESLLDMGYSLPVYGADGIYGKETEKAVLQFQIDKGAVKKDGIVGPETMGLLDQYDPLGAGPTPVPPTPGGVVTLEEINFISDQYLLKDNETASWEDTGSLYPFPEWSSASPGGISAPISQQKATWIRVGVNLGVPVGTSGTYTLEGSSSQSFLSFVGAGTLIGGIENMVWMASNAPLPDVIEFYGGLEIDWKIIIGSRVQPLTKSLGHRIFATYGTPSGGVTYKRMAKAVELTRGFGNKPHDIVSGQMKRFPSYALGKTFFGNIWPIADTMQGECQAIVRFVQAVNDMVGVPGAARGITVYADPAIPDKPVDPPGVLGPHGGPGMSNFAPMPITGYRAWLFDGGDNANNYEAALEFEYGGDKRYYPGGVPGGVGEKTLTEVLHSFKKMAWAEYDPVLGKSVPKITIFCYWPPC
jgi:peptidoglycan hydrolase-like protein with peptidoglycan-binding domain